LNVCTERDMANNVHSSRLQWNGDMVGDLPWLYMLLTFVVWSGYVCMVRGTVVGMVIKSYRAVERCINITYRHCEGMGEMWCGIKSAVLRVLHLSLSIIISITNTWFHWTFSKEGGRRLRLTTSPPSESQLYGQYGRLDVS
jgi:hypothetical protein